MADDMIVWLREQIAEDERLAERAASLCGCHPPAGGWKFDDEETGGRIAIVDDPHPEVSRKPLSRRWNGSYGSLFAAEHIVRHDPARVLREVEAKRAIVAHHPLTVYTDEEPGYSQIVNDHLCPGGLTPCATLRALASVYRGRPGWREEWAVDSNG